MNGFIGNSMTNQILPVIILAIFVVAFGAGLLFAFSFLGPRRNLKDHRKYMPYECGVAGEESRTTKIPVKYYLTAILFILFDIEVVFMYPWALVFRDLLSDMGAFLFIEMITFMLVLIFGLFYVWKNRGLQWE